MSASQAASVPASSSPQTLSVGPQKIPLFLQQIPDVVLEISSHLPKDTALCLALACKDLYALLFHRTLRRLTRRDRHLFLFTLLRDLGDGTRRDLYYCHSCSKIWAWGCPDGKTHRPYDRCPTLFWKHRGFNEKKHACAGIGYFTQTIPEREGNGSLESVALHTHQTAWCRCCEYSVPEAAEAGSQVNES